MKTNETHHNQVNRFIELFNPYLGKTVEQLSQILNIHKKIKSINHLLIKEITKQHHLDQKCILYNQKHCINKTVTLTENGRVKESMSFGNIDFHDMKTMDWKNSKVFKYFSNNTFILFIFQKDKEKTIFKRVVAVDLSKDDLNEIFIVWERVKTLFINNTLVIGGSYDHSVLNFPKSNESDVAHIRPHDSNSKVGKVLLPDGRSIINYCFWLNSKFIETKIKEISEND